MINGRSEKYVSESNRKRHRCGTRIYDAIHSAEENGDAGAPWACEAPEGDILVLHTLVIDPAAAGKGLGRAFVDFYEQGAKSRSCRALRMDTNARNLRARALYKKLGYTEVAIVPCTENGIPDVQLVLPEKPLV